MPPKGALHAKDHVIVKMNGGGRQVLAVNGRARATAEAVRQQLGLPKEYTIQPSGLARLHGIAPGEVDVSRYVYVHLPPGVTPEDAVADLQRNPLVEYAEVDGIGRGGAVAPNDPRFPDQWHLQKTAATAAWVVTTGATEVTVAVLDTGLRYELAEFASRVVPGYDFVNGDTDPLDDQGHGTAVSGVLCANTDNGIGIAGVDWACRIMPMKVLDDQNLGYYSWWADAVDWAVANGCRVINLSAGGSGSSITLTRAIRNAVSNNVVFVTITHNDGTDDVTYPGELPEVIAVGATERDDTKASFSNYGPEIDMVAPGRDIYTLLMNGNVGQWWGTSFSAPQVAGVAALILSILPYASEDDVRSILLTSADDQVGDFRDTPGFDEYHGWGRLNASNAVFLASEALLDLHPADSNRDHRLTIDEVTAYGAAWRNGTPWPVGPASIPIDYVTRCAYLWKNGEAYGRTLGIEPPACWESAGE